MERYGGLSIVFLVAGSAYGLSLLNPVFDPLVIAIIIGILVSNLLEGREWLIKGTSTAIRIFLPVGIATYGFQLKAKIGLDYRDALMVLTVFAMIFFLTFLLSRLLKIKLSAAILLAIGSSICGASAIAVTSSAINADEKDTSSSVLSIMTAGLLLMIFYLMLPEFVSLGQEKLSFLFGSTLPMLGLVKVIASNLDTEYYNRALAIKYFRIFTLFFMVPVAMAIARIEGKKIRIPVFMWFFFVFVLLANIVIIPDNIDNILSMFSGLCLTITLSAIGLQTSLDSVSTLGFRVFMVPVFAILIIALSVIVFF